METIIKDLQQNKEKSNAIIEAANQRAEELRAKVHDEAKKYIADIKEKNQQSLQELKEILEKENQEKVNELQKETKELIDKNRENGEKHLEEIVQLLYDAVIKVEDDE